MTDEELFNRFEELELQLSRLKAMVKNDHDRLTADGLVTAQDCIDASTQFYFEALAFLESFKALKNDTINRLYAVAKSTKDNS